MPCPAACSLAIALPCMGVPNQEPANPLPCILSLATMLAAPCPRALARQDLTWRIIGGSERPKRAPRCIALLIGSNDVHADMPVKKLKSYMDYLLEYLQVRHGGGVCSSNALLSSKGGLPASSSAAGESQRGCRRARHTQACTLAASHGSETACLLLPCPCPLYTLPLQPTPAGRLPRHQGHPVEAAAAPGAGHGARQQGSARGR